MGIEVATMVVPVELIVQVMDALYNPSDYERRHLDQLGMDLERLLANYKEKV